MERLSVVYSVGMAIIKQWTPVDRLRSRSPLSRLTAMLRREGLSAADARRILLPADPWEAARGMWADRRTKAERGQRKLRKEWDRSHAAVSI